MEKKSRSAAISEPFWPLGRNVPQPSSLGASKLLSRHSRSERRTCVRGFSFPWIDVSSSKADLIPPSSLNSFSPLFSSSSGFFQLHLPRLRRRGEYLLTLLRLEFLCPCTSKVGDSGDSRPTWGERERLERWKSEITDSEIRGPRRNRGRERGRTRKKGKSRFFSSCRSFSLVFISVCPFAYTRIRGTVPSSREGKAAQ